MEWILNLETNLTPYGKTHLLEIQELLGKGESAVLNQADGTIRLSVPDAHVKEALTELYESSPALQTSKEKEAFLKETIEAIREDLFKGADLARGIVKAAETKQKKEEAYQEFCKIPGVTEAEKEEARAVTADGVTKNDWISAAAHLQFGTKLVSYGEILKCMKGERKPMNVLRDIAKDLAEAKEVYDRLGKASESIFLNDPKIDRAAAVAASIHIFEPDMTMDDLMAELRDPAKLETYHKEGEAFGKCATCLAILHDEVEAELLVHENDERSIELGWHPNELTANDVKGFLMKTEDVIAAYEYASLREGYDLDPVHPFQMGSDEDRFDLSLAADRIDVLRERSQPDPKESLAEKTMREVFSSNQYNFDYRELTTMAVANLMEQGASNKTLKEAVAIGQDICPSIGKTKDILKAAKKRHQDITLNAGR